MGIPAGRVEFVAAEHGSIDLDEVASARITIAAGDVSVGHRNGPAEIRTSKGDIRIAEAVRGEVLRTMPARWRSARLTIRATTAVGDIIARGL